MDYRRYSACKIQYQPSQPGSPCLEYTVFRFSGQCSTVYRLCIVNNGEFIHGPLHSFTDVIIGEHLTVMPHLNIVKCYSGVYPGLGESTLQLSLQQSAWNRFIPIYDMLLDYGLDWLSLFDMGLYALIR